MKIKLKILTLFLCAWFYCPLVWSMEESGALTEVAGVSPSASASHHAIDIIHPCNDYGFKRAMHQPKVVMGFLNTILHLSEADKIQSVTYLDKELNSADSLGRNFTVDVLCESTGGKRFLIEMQNDFRSDYTTKAFAEFCRLISQWDAQVVHQEVSEPAHKKVRANETLKSVKEFWKDIHTAMTVVITNKRFPESTHKTQFTTQLLMEPQIINTYRMTHDDDPNRYLGDMDARVVIVMLAHFNKTEEQLETIEDKWLYAFKDEMLASGVKPIPVYKRICNLDKTQDNGNSGLSDFYQTLNKEAVRMTGELERYEEAIINANAMLQQREEKGRIEGKAEGEAIGIEKGKAEGKTEGEAMGIEKGKLKGEIKAEISKVKALIGVGVPKEKISTTLKFLTHEKVKEHFEKNFQYIEEHINDADSDICEELGLVAQLSDFGGHDLP